MSKKVKEPALISKLIMEAKIDPKIVRLIELETFCETYHKLPDEVRNMDIFDYRAFSAILSGRGDATNQ